MLDRKKPAMARPSSRSIILRLLGTVKMHRFFFSLFEQYSVPLFLWSIVCNLHVVAVQSPIWVQLFVTPWTAACQAFPLPHHLPEFAQLHVHCTSDAIQPSHPLTSSYPSALNLSQNQGLFQRIVNPHNQPLILEMSTLMFRKVKSLTQGHTASKQQSQDLGPIFNF